MQSMLYMRGIRCRRSGREVLSGVDLDCGPGEMLALLGPNGAGKSTTVGVALGLIRASHGRVQVADARPGSPAARRRVGAMLQDGQPAQGLRAGEWLALARAGHPQPAPLDELIRLTEIDPLLDRPCEALSGGQLQRVRLACALAGRPRLLFLDEPSAGMDVASRQRLWQAIRQLKAQGTGILMTTHQLQEAEALADRVALIEQGRIIAQDRTQAICRQVAGRRVRCQSQLAPELIRDWPEVNRVRVLDEQADTRLEIMTREAEVVVARLLEMDPALKALSVGETSLEEAFLQLTGHPENDPDWRMTA